MEIQYCECRCSSLDHVFRFVYDPNEDPFDDDLYLEVQLHAYEAWYKRAWLALKYVFGRSVPCGFYDVTLLKHEDVARLQEFLARAEAHHGAKVLQRLAAAHEPPSEKPVSVGGG